MTDAAAPATGAAGTGAAAGDDGRRSLGYGAAVAALLLWGGQAVIGKGIDLDPLPLVFYRIWIAVFWSIGVLYASGGRLSVATVRRCIPGGVAFGMDLVLFFTALKLTTVANTTVIASVQPVVLVFAAPLLFKENVRVPDIGLAAVAIAGVVLVVFGASGLPEWSARGDLWAVVCLFAWTGYFMASKAARRTLSAAEFTAGATLVAAVVVTPFALASGQSWGPPTGGDWFWIVVMAIGPGWAGHYLMNWALGHVPIWFGGCVSLASPVASAAMAALFLDESMAVLQVLGIGVTLVALVAMTLRSSQQAGAAVTVPVDRADDPAAPGAPRAAPAS